MSKNALLLMGAIASAAALPAVASERLRVIVETDAGGDPDDEQSLVRFLLYANEWDVEGIIANRSEARERENRNPERTGLGIVRRMLKAYAEVYPKLRLHDERYPPPQYLFQRAVAGHADTGDGEKLILEAVDRDDPRPIWFMNWGTDRGSGPSNLLRALNRVRQERGAAGYAKFKQKLRLSSSDKFEAHTWQIEPAFPLWIDTFRPEIEGRRWYHRFSGITATAGGFDLNRDVLTGHGPLGELYPTNTTHPQKEGDSMTFLYLAPTGMNDPQQPTWGSWAGRYGVQDEAQGKPYYWANQPDSWQGTTHRDNSLARWAAHLQNDFRARLDWCVKDPRTANHPPRPRLRLEQDATSSPRSPTSESQNEPSAPTIVRTKANAGAMLILDAAESTDPDGDQLRFLWQFYREPGTYVGPAVAVKNAAQPRASLVLPQVDAAATLHVVLLVTDAGEPPLTRYGRVVIDVQPVPQRP